jgi:D-alanyl-D-alanine carboxypeptidase/D-alanyl-D-alanine-endopeptidase (penicillin-binding protein 4)
MKHTRCGWISALLLAGTGLMGAGGLAAATLAERVEAILTDTPVARGAFWGIQVVDLASGQTVYEINPGRFFVPASNTKLFSTALALTALGPDATFRTRVLADRAPDGSGLLKGSLRLLGGGDPNLSARTIPYDKHGTDGDPLVAIRDLADQVAAKGVKRVTGDIVGDDRWFVWQPYADGWAVDDPATKDGTAVSALALNDNSQTLSVRPGAAVGLPAALLLSPALEYYQIDNRVRTVEKGGERKVSADRLPGSRTLRIWGAVPLGDRGEDLELGIDDPALYAAMALRQALQERGIVVEGRAVAEHLLPEDVADLKRAPARPAVAGVELARRESAPLVECLRITDKVSQNLHAEMMLRAVGQARRNVGSREAGLEEMKTFLKDAGIPADSYHLLDGSGMARLNLVTPAAVVGLLRHMYALPTGQSFLSLLPVGGEDGTLAARFTGVEQTGRVHAKTGTLSHVSALSGYAERPDRTWVAFAILVNNYNGQSAEIRKAMDRVCALIME